MTGQGRAKRRPVPEEEIELLARAPVGFEVGTAIQEFLQTSGLSRVVLFGAISEMWPALVGKDVFEHCRPVRLDGEDLIVEVDQRGWVTELSFRQRAILDRLAEQLGGPVVSRLKATLPRRTDVE